MTKKVYKQFADLKKGDWQERGSGVFERGWYPNAHYAYERSSNPLYLGNRFVWNSLEWGLEYFE